jgi:hypothetical protein
LPEGVHEATPAEVTFRFGTGSRWRRKLALRLRRWIELGTRIGAHRLLVDGSFVTSKPVPADLDAVMLLPADFFQRLEAGDEAAAELEVMFNTRQPAELFAADQDLWPDWVSFFSQTREADGRRKGIVEVRL